MSYLRKCGLSVIHDSLLYFACDDFEDDFSDNGDSVTYG